MPQRNIELGIIRLIPKNVEETRQIPFILSTYTKDRHGTVLNQDNWNIENYRKNPIVGYQHNLYGNLLTETNPDYVIGTDLNTQIEGTGKDKKLTGLLKFEPADLNPLSEKVFRKVLFGSFSRTSVGFCEIGQTRYGKGDEGQGMKNETIYFEGQELLEWSIVNIPSNPDAGKRMNDLMKTQSRGAVIYAHSLLGDKFSLSQIESMRISDISKLLIGKDLEIKETDPDKVGKLLDNQAWLDNAKIILKQLKYFDDRKRLNDSQEWLDKAKTSFKNLEF